MGRHDDEIDAVSLGGFGDAVGRFARSHVERDPARALTLARRNFDVQKDTADLRLLVEAAAAAGDAATLREARRWLESTGVEDYVARSRLKEAGA